MKKWKWFSGTIFLMFFLALTINPMKAMADSADHLLWNGGMSASRVTRSINSKEDEKIMPETLKTLTTGYTYYADMAVTPNVLIRKAVITIYKNGSFYKSYNVPIDNFIQYYAYPITFDSAGNYSYCWHLEYNFTDLAGTGEYNIENSFKVEDYKLYFYSNGLYISSKNVQYGKTVTFPTVTRTGYTCDYWYTSEGEKVTESTRWSKAYTGSGTSNSCTLYAHWVPNEYKAFYNTNGGDSTNNIEKNHLLVGKTVTYNSTYGTLPSHMVRTGYEFLGWYTSLNGGSRIYENTKMTKTGNHTLYAHWSPRKYTVSFNANEGTVATKDKSITYNSSYGTLPTPTRTGYAFLGWYTQKTGGNKIDKSSKVMTANSHTLYAHWGKVSYKVTFNANGGNVSPGNKSVAYNNTYGTLPTPIRTGYNFTGWYTTANGGEKKTAGSKVGSNHTLYAHWTPKAYKAIFNANGGKCKTTSKAVTYQNTYGSLPTPTRSDYKFLGWYTKKSGGSKINASTTVKITSPQTLYAHWQVVKPKTTKITAQINSSNSVKLSWKKVSGAKGYIVYRSNSKTGSFKKCADVKGALTYTDKNLKTGKVYYYRVTAYKKISSKNVYGKKSNIVKKQIIGPLKQPVQKDIAYNKEKKTYTISWSTVKNAQKIEIFRSVDGAVAKKVGTVSAKQKSVTYSYEKLEKGHKYSFAVRAYYEADGKKIYSGLSNGCAFTKNR